MSFNAQLGFSIKKAVPTTSTTTDLVGAEDNPDVGLSRNKKGHSDNEEEKSEPEKEPVALLEKSLEDDEREREKEQEKTDSKDEEVSGEDPDIIGEKVGQMDLEAETEGPESGEKEPESAPLPTESDTQEAVPADSDSGSETSRGGESDNEKAEAEQAAGLDITKSDSGSAPLPADPPLGSESVPLETGPLLDLPTLEERPTTPNALPEEGTAPAYEIPEISESAPKEQDNAEEMQFPELPDQANTSVPVAEPARPRPHRNDSIVKFSKAVDLRQQHEKSHRPFDFQVFLVHLKDKRADPIVRYIRSFLVLFTRQAGALSTTQMIKAVRQFKLFIADKFTQYEPFLSMDATDSENSMEGIEKLIMNRLYEYTFPPQVLRRTRLPAAMAADLHDDAQFQLQLEKYSFVLGPHLDLDMASTGPGAGAAEYMARAGTELNKINSYRAPRDKIICILNACKILFNYLKVNKQETNADAFIPLLILVILRAKTPHIICNLHYIERFRGDEWLSHGETSYYLLTVQGALTFIQNIKKEDLLIDADEYDAHMEAWAAELAQRAPQAPQAVEAASEPRPPARGATMSPSGVILAGAEMVSKSLLSFMLPSGSQALVRGPEAAPEETGPSAESVDAVFAQLVEIFPSLDKAVMRDIIVMKQADLDALLDVCLQLVNDS